MNTVSQTPQTTIQEMLSTVIDITPAVITRGMEKEAASLAEIKQNLRSLAETFAEPKENRKKERNLYLALAQTSRANMLSIYDTLAASFADDEPSDTDLHLTRVAAEIYLKNHDDYLRYKEACNG